MSAERWQRIKQLFGDALDQPLPARGAWLEAAAADDPSVLAQVAALLAAHEQADDRLEQGAAAVAPGVWQDLQTAVTGLRIGPYRVLSQLGRGGMGAVYLAARGSICSAASAAPRASGPKPSNSSPSFRGRADRGVREPLFPAFRVEGRSRLSGCLTYPEFRP